MRAAEQPARAKYRPVSSNHRRDASPETLRVGIVGAAGYTGAELIRLIHAHPRLDIAYVAAKERAGQKLEEAVPSTAGVRGIGDRVLETFDPARVGELAGRCDVMFLGLPHEASAAAAEALLAAGLTVVDLSAAFRLKEANHYEPWYGHRHATALSRKAIYGLPELHRADLPGAKLIATPGCHVTSALLPLAPLLHARLIQKEGIVIDTKTGVSGAGRSPTASKPFSETAEGVRPYKVAGSHRHTPEIEQELSLVAGAAIRVILTPHLVPMTRGLLATCYARSEAGTTVEACRQAARSMHAEGLVTVLEGDHLPDTLYVRGSARAHVAYAKDERTGTILAMCALDNLSRGASAEALQALNVSMGWPDGLGLPEVGLFP